MPYNGAVAVEGFRKQAQLAAALYRENLKSLGKTTQAFVANDELVAMWSVFEYLSMIPAPADRLGMLRELQRYRGPRPDRPRAPVFREDWYAKHRDRILATLIERFENETDASPLLPRPAYRETG